MSAGQIIHAGLRAVEAEAAAYTARALPFLRTHFAVKAVFGRSEIVMRGSVGQRRVKSAVNMIQQRLPFGFGCGYFGLIPTIVDHAVRHAVIIISEQFIQIIAIGEGDVVPEY